MTLPVSLSKQGLLNKQNDDGFTLIEVLAALSIFAIAAIGLIHVSSENSRGAAAIERRMLASIIADNEMTMTLIQREPLENGESSGRIALGGREWTWRKTISTTPNPLLQQIKIETRVYEPDELDSENIETVLFAFKRKSL
ncbi:type II secretion system minor pseudopilin GspI [Hirschia baltica]|uniref:Type II secretion system protein I n=1 Tax=Hirschia baltica (strain ATCC 49814 / DSM 5838 / IFAM 1418) TaxID=582402 RepID=C6XJ52_HIRBI|nr:type II secretion system minor pseudopilin GspI [Hirschia baltica]ACT59147.1 general secretion pathway protein I [Hirschia baltica ATCC 49814]